jgi:hypothetical protein
VIETLNGARTLDLSVELFFFRALLLLSLLLFEQIDELARGKILDANGEVDDRVVVEVDDVAVVGLLEWLEVDGFAVARLCHAKRQLVLVLDYVLRS